MKNMFKEILDNLPKSKIEITANDPKDQNVADQMSGLINFYRSGSSQNVDTEYVEMCRGLSMECFEDIFEEKDD